VDEPRRFDGGGGGGGGTSFLEHATTSLIYGPTISK
jgi:hypothetical protein